LCPIQQFAIVPFFAPRRLSVKDVRIESENVYGYEALCLLVVKKGRTRFANVLKASDHEDDLPARSA
jgi:hypothetical protein